MHYFQWFTVKDFEFSILITCLSSDKYSHVLVLILHGETAEGESHHKSILSTVLFWVMTDKDS